MASRIIAKDPAGKAEMLSKVRSLPRYIIQNNLTLVDVDGKTTEWGHWEPARLNGLYAVSDDRGNNALEMLGFLAAGLAACAHIILSCFTAAVLPLPLPSASFRTAAVGVFEFG